MRLDFTQPPSQALYKAIQAGFVAHNQSMSEWCKANAVHHPHLKQVLLGVVNGKKSIALRNKVIADVQALEEGA